MMNRKPVTFGPETHMRDVAKVFLKKKVPCAAVIDDDHRFVGLVSTQGLMLAVVDAVYEEVPPGTVKGYIDPDPPRLTERMSLMQVAELFVKGGYTHRALPVMKGDRLVGVVSRLSVVQAVVDYFKGVTPGTQAASLYISALKELDEKPPFE
jgi:CBS domain-containing protein